MHTKTLKKLVENIVKQNNPMAKKDWDNLKKSCKKEAEELVEEVSCYHRIVTLSGCHKVGENYHEEIIRYKDWDVQTQQMNCEYIFGPKFQLSKQDAIEHIYNYLLMKYKITISWI